MSSSSRQAPRQFKFNAAYYRKFYQAPRTRVADPQTCAALADFVFAYLKYLRVPVENVLDLGCGVGLWRPEVLRHHPTARYVGVEKSEYACRKHGWERGCLTNYRSKESFDLVICQGVLQYLDEGEADAAIRNLTHLATPALYLEILTLGDWERNCNRETTDGEVYLRSASWYRERLRPGFVACGGGLFLARSSPAVLYELEFLA